MQRSSQRPHGIMRTPGAGKSQPAPNRAVRIRPGAIVTSGSSVRLTCERKSVRIGAKNGNFFASLALLLHAGVRRSNTRDSRARSGLLRPSRTPVEPADRSTCEDSTLLDLVFATAVALSTAARSDGLPSRAPAAVGMSASRLEAIDRVVGRGIAAGGYPGAAVVVGRKGYSVWEKGFGRQSWSPGSEAVSPDRTIYDLASLSLSLIHI